ncbi:FAD-dependent oxidoreductase [Kribbella antibiotica]|uniref:FAD-dependent oxidoreductase n=2 Tax=Kribbella antibiotica TaxID=190195 RepID=A0A4R4ZVF5_9ACTN|nr:FAD-dependent oxidoreductase [Kribbella antibiotica]
MYDVAIVGAGPVGLFLACELGLQGCSVVVLEREAEAGSVWRAAPLGLRGLMASSLAGFYRRGLLPDLLEVSEGILVADEPLQVKGFGHFAGIMIDPDKVDLAALPHRLPTPAPEGLMTPLAHVEQILAERAVKYGVEIRRGAEATELTQYDDHVVVRAGDDDYAARWVVGTDGGRSAVRRLAGFEFVGTEPLFTGYTMQVELDDPGKLKPGFNPTENGMYVAMRIGGHIGVLDFDHGAFDRSQELTKEHLQDVLRRVSGTDVTITELGLASTYTDRALQATTYRKDRVLLAGDAAHIHSPLGGQGLNTGLGDAMNLGWKLAATIQGHAPDDLLDTYTAERHPVGEWVLDWTRAQVTVLKPGAHGRALQGVMREMLDTPDGATYIYKKISGMQRRYDLGSEHPLVGRIAPEFRLQDGTRLADLMTDGRGVLLDFTGELNGLDLNSHFRYAAGPAIDDLGLAAVLVRPDGVVAWAGDADRDAFEQAAKRYFG